jgi:hypothetical protein
MIIWTTSKKKTKKTVAENIKTIEYNVKKSFARNSSMMLLFLLSGRGILR